jgi:predicted dehydrogenase
MFRVDNHLYHYLPVLTKLDMLRLREISPECHYWFTDCYFPLEVVPKVATGFEVTKICDYDPGRAHEAAEVFIKRPEIVEDPRDLARNVDAAFIANCSEDGSDHLELSEPLIRKKIPTFIDKPFALSTKDAVAMVRLARRHKTPIYSASLLRVVEQAEFLRRQFKRIGGVVSGVVNGAPGWYTESGQEGVIHGVSLVQAVFGSGVRSVFCHGDHPGHYAAITYESGLQVHMHLANGIAGYTVEVFGANRDPNLRSIHSGMIGNVDYSAGASTIAHHFKRMIRTGKPPQDYEEMIENIAVCEALLKSRKLGRKVKISEVWKR